MSQIIRCHAHVVKNFMQIAFLLPQTHLASCPSARWETGRWTTCVSWSRAPTGTELVLMQPDDETEECERRRTMLCLNWTLHSGAHRKIQNGAVTKVPHECCSVPLLLLRGVSWWVGTSLISQLDEWKWINLCSVSKLLRRHARGELKVMCTTFELLHSVLTSIKCNLV